MTANDANQAKSVKIDKSLCCGYGVCKESCPEIFELGDGGLVELVTDTVPAELEAKAIEAAEACPQAVITIE